MTVEATDPLDQKASLTFTLVVDEDDSKEPELSTDIPQFDVVDGESFDIDLLNYFTHPYPDTQLTFTSDFFTGTGACWVVLVFCSFKGCLFCIVNGRS